MKPISGSSSGSGSGSGGFRGGVGQGAGSSERRRRRRQAEVQVSVWGAILLLSFCQRWFQQRRQWQLQHQHVWGARIAYRASQLRGHEEYHALD
jgi:hypothetical protein